MQRQSKNHFALSTGLRAKVAFMEVTYWVEISCPLGMASWARTSSTWSGYLNVLVLARHAWFILAYVG